MSFFKNPFKSNTDNCDNTVDFNVVPNFEKNDLQGKNGINGKNITIINSYTNPDGNTVIKFSDGSSIVVNKGLTGATGPAGPKGDTGESITILSTNSEVGPTGTTVEINFSDTTILSFFIQRGETGDTGDNGISIVNATVDLNPISATYGHLLVELSDATIIDTGYVLGSLGGVAGGELDGNYPNPDLKNSAVIGKVLTGLSLATGGAIAATDTILQAFGKLQKQITDLPLSFAFTQGSVLFGNGTGITQDNSKFFWDNTFKTLILGSNSITPTDEQLIIYNGVTAKALLSGVLGASLTLKSTSLTDRNVTLRSGTLGAQLFSSSNVPLSLFINGRSDGIELDINGRTSLFGGLSTNIRYVNVDSLTVNIAKNENFVLINAGVITGITGATPLTIILPETPLDGQEVSFGVCNGTSGITLGTAEILIQGFGGTSIVINQLPELNGGLNNGISSATYKYSSSIGRWFRIN